MCTESPLSSDYKFDIRNLTEQDQTKNQTIAKNNTEFWSKLDLLSYFANSLKTVFFLKSL